MYSFIEKILSSSMLSISLDARFYACGFMWYLLQLHMKSKENCVFWIHCFSMSICVVHSHNIVSGSKMLLLLPILIKIVSTHRCTWPIPSCKGGYQVKYLVFWVSVVKGRLGFTPISTGWILFKYKKRLRCWQVKSKPKQDVKTTLL